MNTASDHIVAGIGLAQAMSLATSALPDAPIVPDVPRGSIITRARRAIAAARQFVSRPTLSPSKEPTIAQSS